MADGDRLKQAITNLLENAIKFTPQGGQVTIGLKRCGSDSGVGMGLAIARHLVELHHGKIEAASGGEGQGATFTIRLPLTSAADIKSEP